MNAPKRLTNMAAFPPDVCPETGPKRELPPQFRRTLIDFYSKEPTGTIIIDTWSPQPPRHLRCGFLHWELALCQKMRGATTGVASAAFCETEAL